MLPNFEEHGYRKFLANGYLYPHCEHLYQKKVVEGYRVKYCINIFTFINPRSSNLEYYVDVQMYRGTSVFNIEIHFNNNETLEEIEKIVEGLWRNNKMDYHHN